MADVGIRVTLEGAEQAKQGIASIEKSIEDLVKQAKALGIDVESYGKSITKLTTNAKAYETLLSATLKSEIASVEAKKKLSDGARELGEKLIPAGKGLKDLGDTLIEIGTRRLGLHGLSNDIQKIGESLTGISGISAKATLAIAAIGTTAAIAGGVIVSKFLGGFNAVKTLGDEFNNLSQRTGIAVEKLSGGLRLAAETSGTSVQALATGVNMLNRSISEAADGTGRQAEAFKRLGISVQDANGNIKSADRILDEIAEAFKGSADGATKTEIAMKLLGIAGTNLIPLLNQGAGGLRRLQKEAELAGIVIDKETSEAASKLNENLRVLKAYGEGFWMSVASPMVEGLRKITDAMRDARREGAGWLSSLQAGAAKALQMSLGIDSPEAERDNAIRKLTELERQAAQARAKGQTGLARGSEEAAAFWRSERDRLNAVIAAPQNFGALGEFGTGGAGLREILPPAGRPDAGKGSGAARGPTLGGEIASAERYWRDLIAIGELTEEEHANLLERMANAIDGNEKVKTDLLAKAAAERKKISAEESRTAINENDIWATRRMANDANIAKWEKFWTEDAQEVSHRAAKAEIRQINETTFLFKEQKIEALEALRLKYIALEEDGTKGLKSIKGELEAVRGSTRTTGVVVQQAGIDMGVVWKQVHQGLVTSFTEIGKWAIGIKSSVTSMGDAIKSLFASIAGSIIEMFARIAADKVFQWIFGGGSALGASGAASGAVGGAVSGASQGLFGNLFGGSGGGGGGNLISNLFGGNIFDANSIIGSTIANFGGGTLIAGAGAGTALAGEAAALGIAQVGGGALAGVGAALPWIGAGLFAASALGLFGGDDEPPPGYRRENWMDLRSSGSSFYVGSSEVPDPQNMPAIAGALNALLNDPKFYNQATLGNLIGTTATVAAGGGTQALATALIQLLSPAQLFATGGNFVATSPRSIIVGDVPERVDIQPLASGGRSGRGDGGITISVSGLSLLDNYAARKLAYELRRQLRA